MRRLVNLFTVGKEDLIYLLSAHMIFLLLTILLTL